RTKIAIQNHSARPWSSIVDQRRPTAFRGIRKGFMIPEEKKTGVARALQESFGVTDFTAITRMTKGLSSDLVFRIVVRDTPYLLRIMTRIAERMDPNRIITCMNAASAAGLTPCVRYANAEA